jgi:hypothetical protein
MIAARMTVHSFAVQAVVGERRPSTAAVEDDQGGAIW